MPASNMSLHLSFTSKPLVFSAALLSSCFGPAAQVQAVPLTEPAHPVSHLAPSQTQLVEVGSERGSIPEPSKVEGELCETDKEEECKSGFCQDLGIGEGPQCQPKRMPQSQCHVQHQTIGENTPEYESDVNIFWMTLDALIKNYPDSLGKREVTVTDILPNSGSGTYWYGCPHMHLEESSDKHDLPALLGNDLDGVCNDKAKCSAAFTDAHDANAGFFCWKGDRNGGARIMDIETFFAPGEGEVFAPGGKYAWKGRIVELYESETTGGPTGWNPQQLVYPPGEVDGEGKLTVNTRVAKAGDQQRKLNIPSCAALCKFKRIMLAGQPEQRAGEAAKGLKKLKQDLLDIKCLMQSCHLNHLCEKTETAGGTSLTVANINEIAWPLGKDKDKAPAATELIDFMGTTEFTSHQPHVQCGALGNKIPREWQSWGDYFQSFITPEYVASITSPQAWIDWWNSPAHANDDYIWTKKSAGYFYAGIDTSDVPPVPTGDGVIEEN